MKAEWRAWLDDLSATFKALWRLAAGPPALEVPHEALLERTEAAVAALHPRTMRLRLVEVVPETPSTKTLRFQRTDAELPPFRPGQYVSLALQIGPVATTRPYSISSPSGLDCIDLTVKNNPGGFVAPYLLEQTPGWEVTSSGPAGSFVYEPLRDRGPLVLLAGGSGITPFMAMLRHFAQVGFPAPVQLLFGSRRADDVIFGDELDRLAAEHAAFDAVTVLSEPPEGYAGPAGFLDADFIGERVGDVAGKSFFLCGPEAMIEHVALALDTLGVPAHAIRRESFGPPGDVAAAPGWPAEVDPSREFSVEVAGHGRLPARASEPLLSVLERGGLSVPSACRTGECAECRMRLVSGTTWSPPDAGVREADAAQGYIHTCVAYATSDVELAPSKQVNPGTRPPARPSARPPDEG